MLRPRRSRPGTTIVASSAYAVMPPTTHAPQAAQDGKAAFREAMHIHPYAQGGVVAEADNIAKIVLPSVINSTSVDALYNKEGHAMQELADLRKKHQFPAVANKVKEMDGMAQGVNLSGTTSSDSRRAMQGGLKDLRQGRVSAVVSRANELRAARGDLAGDDSLRAALLDISHEGRDAKEESAALEDAPSISQATSHNVTQSHKRLCCTIL